MKKNTIYLEALSNNDTEIIREFYQPIFFKVRSFILKNKGQIADAEDIFQKALMQIAVRYQVDKFEIKSSFDAYLFTVCKNLWRKELKAAKIRVTKYNFTELDNEYDTIANSVVEQGRWELFTEKLGGISGKCKELLDLYFSDLAYNSIVEKFNYRSEHVARQAVYKCKERLKEMIKKDKRFNTLLDNDY